MATRDGVWKWVAGMMAAVMTSSFATAMTFRTSDEHIKEVVSESFTEISHGRGMYALEGRKRLEALETNNREIRVTLRETADRLTRVEAKIDQLLKR